MVAQMWQQSPAIMTMVSGLLLFGVYSVVAYFRDEPSSASQLTDLDRNAASFETLTGMPQDGLTNRQP